jgi:hypothetical protein
MGFIKEPPYKAPFKVWWEVPGKWDTTESRTKENLKDAQTLVRSKVLNEDVDSIYIEDATGRIIWEYT